MFACPLVRFATFPGIRVRDLNVGPRVSSTFHLKASLNSLKATPVLNKTIDLRIAFNLRPTCRTLKMPGTTC